MSAGAMTGAQVYCLLLTLIVVAGAVAVAYAPHRNRKKGEDE